MCQKEQMFGQKQIFGQSVPAVITSDCAASWSAADGSRGALPEAHPFARGRDSHMNSELHARLQALGMTAYEAKTYAAMVAAAEPLTGYEAAKQSGVPRSTVYETLARLVNRGAAFEVRGSCNNVAYVPLPPDALIRRMRRDFDENVDALTEEIGRIGAPPTAHLINNLKGRRAVIDRAKDLIGSARAELYLSIWSEEIPALSATITAAEQRGVEISSVAFGDDTGLAGKRKDHIFAPPDVVLRRMGCRLLVIVADMGEILIGGATDGTTWGMYSDDPAVVLLGAEYIRHDIAVEVMTEEMGVEATATLFATDPWLTWVATGRGATGLTQSIS